MVLFNYKWEQLRTKNLWRYKKFRDKGDDPPVGVRDKVEMSRKRGCRYIDVRVEDLFPMAILREGNKNENELLCINLKYWI